MVIAYVGIVCITTYIGFIFSKKYVIRYKIYNQLIEFLNYYKLQICYAQKKLLDVAECFAENNEDDYIHLDEFINYLKVEFYNINNFVFNDNLEYLSKLECSQIESIYNSLGKFDLMQEKQNIDLILLKLNGELLKAKDIKVKYCGFCVKIGIIFGCFIIVLLL